MDLYAAPLEICKPELLPFAAVPQDSPIILRNGSDLAVEATTNRPPKAALLAQYGLLAPEDICILVAGVGSNPVYTPQRIVDFSALPTVLTHCALRGYMANAPKALRQSICRAMELNSWMLEHRHCGCCGGITAINPSTGALHCHHCKRGFFPVISPAIIVRITRGKQILLARNRNFTRPVFSNIAGFVESGENFEEAVHREVQEEIGIRITDLQYFGSQNWPYPHSILAAFTAQYAGGEIRPDGEEIVEAKWFTLPQELPLIPDPGSISRQMIDDFLEHLSATNTECQ